MLQKPQMSDLLDDLLEVLDGSRRYEHYIASLCPFHDDHRPSLLIFEDYYRCLSCDAHGKTSTLLDKIKGNLPKPKLSSWHNPFTSWLRDYSLNKIMTSAWKFLKNNPCYGNYLVRRGIPIDKQIELGLGWWDGWHTFPITSEENSLVGAVIRCGEGLDLPAKYVNPSEQDPNLLYVPDWKLIKSHREIYLTFGIIDSISLVLYNLPGMSTTTGKRLDPKALDKFRKRIVFLPDQGEESEALKIASKLGWRGVCPKIRWPDGCKDVSDVHQKFPEILQLTFWDGSNGTNMARYK